MKGARGLDGMVSARALFLCGAVVMPAFLFQQDLAIKSALVLLAVVLCIITGRRTRLVTLLVMSAGIVAFNLAVPSGRVIFKALGLSITDGALRGGVAKAATVAGMIALSRLTISPELELPGALGGLVGRCFMYFELIMGSRNKIRREAFIESIDGILRQTYGTRRRLRTPSPAPRRTSWAGFALLAAFSCLNWAALALSLVFPALIWHR